MKSSAHHGMAEDRCATTNVLIWIYLDALHMSAVTIVDYDRIIYVLFKKH